MKTKYIKVSVQERLPEKDGMYFCITYSDKLFRFNFHPEAKAFIKQWADDVEYWLKEVPDRDEEMREMLSRIQDLDILPEEIENEVSNLLNELKQ